MADHLPENDRLTRVETTAGQPYVETDFRVDFKEYLAVVRLRDGDIEPVVLVVDIDYTVSQLGADAGCRVTFTPDPAQAEDVYILLGEQPVARTNSFVQLGGVSAASLDAELDAFTRQLQEMAREIARTFKTDRFSAEPVFDFEGRRILNVGDPIAPGDAVNLGSIQAKLDEATAAATSTSGDNAAATAADRVQTGLDRAATAADRVQTGLDRSAAAASAVAAATSEAAVLGQLGIGRLAEVGDIKFQTTTHTPAGWMRLKRDPQALNKVEYPELNARYAADGYPYGSTSGTFNIPGVAGLFLRPWDDTSTNDPDAASRLTHAGAPGAGNVIGSRQASENKQHNHGITQTPHGHTASSNGQGIFNGGGLQGGGFPAFGNQAITVNPANANITIDNAGGNESRPTNVAFPLIILVNPTLASVTHTPFGLPFLWDTATADANPGTGKLRLNHATLGSATFAYVSKTGANSADVAAVLALSNSIASGVRAVLTIYHAGAWNNAVVASVTGAVVDGGAYVKVPITILSAVGSLTNGVPLCVQIGLTAGGPQGDAGWSPVYALVADGDRVVQKIVDWQGGAGTKPAVNKYVGAAGLVDNIADGVSVRGDVGLASWSPVYAIVADGTRRVQKVVDWVGGAGTKPAVNVYVGVDGFKANIADGVDVRGASGAGTGDVVGPGAAVGSGNLVSWSGTGGASVADSGKAPSTDGTMAADSDAKLPTEKAVRTYVAAAISAVLGGVSSAFDTLSEIAAALAGKLTASSNLSDVGSAATAFGNIKQAATTAATGVTELAVAAEYRANAAGNLSLTPAEVWAAAVEVGLVDAATIAVDMGTFINASVTLGGNRTLGTPSNAKPGQSGRIRIIQDGTGSRTLAFAANWKFVGGQAPVLSTAASAEDWLYYDVATSTAVLGWLVRGVA
jgi:hypothetical protein